MKKALLLLAMVVLPFIAFSQHKAEQAYIYNIISFAEKWDDTGLKVDLDNGYKIQPFKDENGKRLKFRTPAAILTYLSSKGWELQSIHVASRGVNNKKSTTFWVIRKACTQEELEQVALEGVRN